ncbi:MAG: hypothetical protein CMM16_01015 [Rhodospirillaceae bacterium]|nr:hypothetical protein [Rhodospirillaceae bacterium]|tara:strand:- start:470 stop:679 length:210 start_codon:yes stop_codon:yes gene_type:complete
MIRANAKAHGHMMSHIFRRVFTVLAMLLAGLPAANVPVATPGGTLLMCDAGDDGNEKARSVSVQSFKID